jgi:hypothetical protein
MARSRVAWCGLVAVLACGMLPAGPSGAAAARAASPRVVTLSGTIGHLAAEGRRTEVPTRTVLSSGGRHYYLAHVRPSVASGSVVRVTGSLAGRRLTVTRLVTLRDARPAPLRHTAKGVTRTLVVPVYWNARPPAKPTRGQLKSQIVDYSRAWFRTVSHGRYSIKGTVAPWLRISTPHYCTDFFPNERNVYSHLRKKGVNPSHYGRIIIYFACRDSFLAGQASLPGRTVELYGLSYPQVVVHEQGHNLGLDHAGSLTCKKSGVLTVRDGRCAFSEYGDDTDPMGSTSAGFYSAPRCAALGWLHGVAGVGHTTTKTLVPYESPGGGLHAIKLRAGRSTTYWLEYRTRTGYDKQLTAGDIGLQVRLPGPGRHTRQLDLLPVRSSYFSQRDGTALGLRGSWQTPEGVRMTVTRISAAGLTVSFDFSPGKPGPPTAPQGLQLTPVVNGITVGWQPPGQSRGAPVTAYRVTNLSTGRTDEVSAASETTLDEGALKATKSYQFTVQARNQYGWGAVATSTSAQPLAGPPTATIQAPSTAFGVVQFPAYGDPNPDSGAPITSAQTFVDGQPLGSIASDQATVPTAGLGAGPHVFSVTVTDSLGHTATASQPVTVVKVGLSVQSPAPGATVGDTSQVLYTLSNAAPVLAVDAYVDGSLVASGEPPVEGGNALDAYWGGTTDGPHTLQLIAWSDDGNSSLTVSVPIVVSNP